MPSVKFKHRHCRQRVLLPEFGTAVDGLADVDFLVRNDNILLGEKDADAPRIWSGRAVENFHMFPGRYRHSILFGGDRRIRDTPKSNVCKASLRASGRLTMFRVPSSEGAGFRLQWSVATRM